MKKLSTIIVFSLSLLLSGCFFWKDETTKEINFNGFTISIEESFKKISSSSIENKQILGKIIHSFKKEVWENQTWFNTNLIISKTELKENSKSENFWKVNISKIQKNIPWYKEIEKIKYNIKCDDKSINSILHSFSMPKEIFNSDEIYYISQYYFNNKDIWYIISFASDNKNNLENFKNYVKTIKCN